MLKAIVNSFLASFGVTATVISGFDIKRWIFLLSCFAVAALTSTIQWFHLRHTKKKFQNFFSIEDRLPFNIAIASMYDNRPYDEKKGEKANYRYFKNNGKSELVGSITHPLCDIGTAEEAVKFANYVSKMGKHEINLYGDENLPRSFKGPVICLGSPTSNRISGLVINRLPSNMRPVFTTKTLTIPGLNEYRSCDDIDYAVLIKKKVNDNTYFICAGIDEHGSITVSKLLMNDWKNLPSASDFIKVYKVNKERCHVDAVELEKIITE